MGKNAGSNLQYGPRTRLVRGMYTVHEKKSSNSKWSHYTYPRFGQKLYACAQPVIRGVVMDSCFGHIRPYQHDIARRKGLIKNRTHIRAVAIVLRMAGLFPVRYPLCVTWSTILQFCYYISALFPLWYGTKLKEIERWFAVFLAWLPAAVRNQLALPLDSKRRWTFGWQGWLFLSEPEWWHVKSFYLTTFTRTKDTENCYVHVKKYNS